MKIAFIGMGTMGVGMALNILKAGHEVTVQNRTREKEEGLAEKGAKAARFIDGDSRSMALALC